MLTDFFNIFSSYFLTFSHPVRIHDYLKYNIPIPGHNPYPSKLNITESIMVSWFCVFIGGIFNLLISLVAYSNLNSEDVHSILNLAGYDSLYLAKGFSLIFFSNIIDIIFYPLFKFLMIEFWQFVLKMFADVLGEIKDVEDKIESIMSSYLSSNFLQIIPIVGMFASGIYEIFQMIIAIRKQFEVNTFIAVLIILFPTFLFLALILMMFYLLFLMIN